MGLASVEIVVSINVNKTNRIVVKLLKNHAEIACDIYASIFLQFAAKRVIIEYGMMWISYKNMETACQCELYFHSELTRVFRKSLTANDPHINPKSAINSSAFV